MTTPSTLKSGMPLITLSGDAASRGYQHGAALRARIHHMIDVYGRYFGLREAQVFETAQHFKKVIAGFEPAYAAEIEAIAEGAEAHPLWIYALNARSEFLSYVPVSECTLLHFEGTPYLGQNWDWEEQLEPLIALVRIERDNAPPILMMTEPGIIGKIGLNGAGVGVCFNFLYVDRPTTGVPVHVLLRALLESPSLGAARQTIARAGDGRSANIMVADKSGARFDVEFAATEHFEIDDRGDVLTHTNHFIDRDMFITPDVLENSSLRLARVKELCAAEAGRDLAAMKAMLSDGANPGNAICQPYRPREPLGNMGTVCSLAMNLEAGFMDIRLGNDAAGAFERVSLLEERAGRETVSA